MKAPRCDGLFPSTESPLCTSRAAQEGPSNPYARSRAVSTSVLDFDSNVQTTHWLTAGAYF